MVTGSAMGNRTPAKQLTWINAVIKVSPIIKPNLGETSVVFIHYFGGSSRKRIRGGFAKNVAHMGTSGYFQRTTAHPNLTDYSNFIKTILDT